MKLKKMKKIKLVILFSSSYLDRDLSSDFLSECVTLLYRKQAFRSCILPVYTGSICRVWPWQAYPSQPHNGTDPGGTENVVIQCLNLKGLLTTALALGVHLELGKRLKLQTHSTPNSNTYVTRTDNENSRQSQATFFSVPVELRSG